MNEILEDLESLSKENRLLKLKLNIYKQALRHCKDKKEALEKALEEIKGSIR